MLWFSDSNSCVGSCEALLQKRIGERKLVLLEYLNRVEKDLECLMWDVFEKWLNKIENGIFVVKEFNGCHIWLVR